MNPSSWILTIFFLATLSTVFSEDHPYWQWECQESKCRKVPFNSNKPETALSLAACQMFCDANSLIWPKPTGKLEIGSYLLHININSIDIVTAKPDSHSGILVIEAAKRFKEQVSSLQPKQVSTARYPGRSVVVTIILTDYDKNSLTLDTKESYILTANQTLDGRFNATITADNFFGARHGLETLSQLFIYDDIRNEVQVARDVLITDAPAYPYRGILLDTSRNYISIDGIKRTLEGMALTKLNTFHWHITDTHSFPFVSPKRPELSKIGAYSPSKVYTPADIKELVLFAKVRGIRILPEFDAPAHVGEGWQNTDFLECFNAEPWSAYCVEPPCGQLNPTKPGLYDVLEDIYSDMITLFEPDLFHMGGDEVSLKCWNVSTSIIDWMKTKKWDRSKDDFMKLWNFFQTNALQRLEKQHPAQKDVPVILWTSTLTEKNYVDYLPKEKYIIEVWTTGRDSTIKQLLNKDYRLIIANYDALYFDCGFGAWIGSGNNWCSPYIGWQKVYNNDLRDMAYGKNHLILGSEGLLWTEQADDSSIDGRIWPRGAAMGERLWSDPKTDWEEAAGRMLIHRDRMVDRGIAADTLQPHWCVQNEGYCIKN